ncbi:MAG TPA: gliding motility-associated C-terminal domain-containing protein, partial [Chitinophagaceae bacterium]|nr:gliding motility-associated C-terminal domain-containing protein [Chitinophagaceae bacterium]
SNDPTIKTIDNSPVPGKIYSHTYAEFGTPATNTYTIRYVAYSGITCVNTFSQTVTLLATPTLQFDPINAVCSNATSFPITGVQVLNGLTGNGVFSGNSVSTAGLFDPAASGVGVHTIRYTYTAANGCTNYIEQTVEVYPTPVANAGPDKVVLEGGIVTLTPSIVNNIPVSYLWTPSIGLNNPAIANAIASPPDDITYTLTVTSDHGCSTSDQVFVKVLKKPVIPNIFSPNGDGVHDRWEIAALDSYPGCTVDVFNRYGQLIYHSIGYANPWDGTVNGKPVPVGTYYYIVDPKNGRQKMAGYVDVIR